jgi:hypothetical protein
MKRPPVLHPFLFALFPILALYAHNIRSIPVPLKEAAGPLAASLAAAAVLFLLLSAAFRSPAKAGLGVSIIVLWLLSFGHLAGWVAYWTEGLFTRSLFFATALLIALALFAVVRSRRDFAGITRVLNVVSATLVLLNVASVAHTLAGKPRIAAGPEVKASGPTAGRPNIYYLVLDAYTRGDILQEVFSFDNAPFLAGLEARGFTVADRSYANFNLTHQSLASSLNFSLLDDVARDAGGASSDREPLYSMIRENRVMAFLKGQGYRLITVSSSIEPTDFRSVDRYFGFASSESEFRSVLLNTTPWPVLFGSARSAESYDAHRRRILNAFHALEESPREKGPFFMFVHIMAPHPPFVFGPNGEPVDPGYLFAMVDADRLHGANPAALPEYIRRYRDQLVFLNTRILEAVDAILRGSAASPVIVVQGDHGSRAYTDFDRPEASYFKENLAILNAYHLPGGAASLVYPGISPVNTFRLIFKYYFGADLELLEDRSAWCTWRRPYKFLPFDERTYGGTVDSVKAAMTPKPPIIQTR